MTSNQLQSRIRSSPCNSNLSYQGHFCLDSSLGKRKAQYIPNDVSITNTFDNSLVNRNTATKLFGDWPFDASSGALQVSGEVVPSPEQISSITSCSDGDGYSDSGLVDGGPFLYDSSSSGLACEAPIQNYGQKSHLLEGTFNSINHGGLSYEYDTRFPSSVSRNSKIPSPNLDILQKNSLEMREGLKNWSYIDITEKPCEGILSSQSKMAIPGHSGFFNSREDLEYCSLENSHGFDPTVSSHILHILFGATDASKIVNMDEKTLQEDILSYRNYKWLHNDGSETLYLEYMHLKACNERECNCSRYVVAAHFENCNLLRCNICEAVRRLFYKGKTPLKHKIQENNCVNIPVEDGPPPRKCLKMASSILYDTGVSYEIPPSVNHNLVSERQYGFQQLPAAPCCHTLDTSSYGAGVPSTFQNLSGHVSFGNDVAYTAETLIADSRTGGQDKVTENIQHSDSCQMNFSSGEMIVEQQEYEGVCKVNSDQAKLDVKSDSASEEANNLGTKASEGKIVGVSLIDFFTEKEVKKHLSSLSSSVSQETEEILAGSVGENTCQLCFMDKLFFAVVPVYCSCCSAQIKPGLLYHTSIDEMGTRHSFCSRCLKASKGSEILLYGISFPKQNLLKQYNTHKDEEPWVQCDKCKGWQHQICALYNDKRDLGGDSEYVCPKCYLVGIRIGEYKPLTRTGAFEAKDLPTTKLSDHIEKRLFRRLKEEREGRAKALQMKYEEVPGASDLVVRVVLSVSKLLNVKQQFLDIIPDEKYPAEFPFKSKVILLFQKIEGVDVCLFGFYVQEFGSECGHPNQRSVYISYLDSVKYLRPEVKTASGEALRTMIYHELLIGYLDYCKKQGFATCYIWACPPTNREDYILYCHPAAQKKPRSDKLRNWYKSMLRKAAEEEIAVDYTNLHDHFFVSNGGHNSKITLARLPYFDGDYWSVAAMDIIRKVGHENGEDSQIKAKKILTKRNLKSMGYSNNSGDVVKDILVMQKLSQAISPVKEDFIMVHLQFTCSSCHQGILSGSRWYCYRCRNFHLCSRCHASVGSTHTSSSGERHALFQATVNDVASDTDDRDVILDNGFLEYRHSFLGFCQGNQFQFDTLRRAKHSSMMILYHLHNSTLKSVETNCCLCGTKMLAKKGWNCVTCPEFNACDGCYRRKGGDCHVHKLNRSSSLGNHGSGNGKAPHELLRRRGVMEGLLMHASQCLETKINACPYPNCSKIKNLWRHAYQCKLKVSGGCQPCQKTWSLLRLHSENCKDFGCRVPRCMDLKKHMDMLKLQSDARQNAAVLGSVRGD